MTKDMHRKSFDDTTQLKLEIFRECFREWFPVFLNDRWTKEVFIFDFFAGSGKDASDVYGSPLILLEEAKGSDRQFCGKIKKPVQFVFNEAKKEKSLLLKSNTDLHVSECEVANQCGGCVYERDVLQSDFKSIFKDPTILKILSNKDIGKFILLDQYGFSQIDDQIFNQLINFPKTDFIFFITSSFIKRFQEHPSVQKYFDTERIEFETSLPRECHRNIAKYFRTLLPSTKEYYLHHFSIQKENKGNYYGLIFGSNHSLGMEKFLKVCWQKDPFSGESNFNIDNDFEQGTLFCNESNSNKKQEIKKRIEEMVMKGEIVDNLQGLKVSMWLGGEPKLFTSVVQELEAGKKIKRSGSSSYASTNIHRAPKYYIERLK